jgi:hypothetical protein
MMMPDQHQIPAELTPPRGPGAWIIVGALAGLGTYILAGVVWIVVWWVCFPLLCPMWSWYHTRFNYEEAILRDMLRFALTFGLPAMLAGRIYWRLLFRRNASSQLAKPYWGGLLGFAFVLSAGGTVGSQDLDYALLSSLMEWAFSGKGPEPIVYYLVLFFSFQALVLGGALGWLLQRAIEEPGDGMVTK